MASIDQVKNYWNARPCNIRHSKKSINSVEYSREVTERKYFVEPHISPFAQFEKWIGKTVLEVGCGIGTDTLSFARCRAKVIAVDLSQNSIDVAQARAKAEHLHSNIKFICGSIEDPETINQIKGLGLFNIDLIYSFGVLHHTPNITVALENVSHCVHHGTPLKLMVYNRNSIRTLEIILESWKDILLGRVPLGEDFIDNIVAMRSEAQTGCPITRTYTPQSITNTLSTHFKVTNITKEHIFPYQVESYKNMIYKKKMRYKILPKTLFSFLERNFGWHLCIDAIKI